MATNKTDATILTSIVAARRVRDVRPYYLEQTEGQNASQKIALSSQELVLGRAEDADIRIASQRASRQHAFLRRTGSDYTIRDNESRNGILLNGIKIYSAVLRDGDIIQVADSVFIYHEG